MWVLKKFLKLADRRKILNSSVMCNNEKNNGKEKHGKALMKSYMVNDE